MWNKSSQHRARQIWDESGGGIAKSCTNAQYERFLITFVPEHHLIDFHSMTMSRTRNEGGMDQTIRCRTTPSSM